MNPSVKDPGIKKDNDKTPDNLFFLRACSGSLVQ